MALGLLAVYTRQISALRESNARRAAEIVRVRERSDDQAADMRAQMAALEARCLKSDDLSNVHQRVDKLTKEVHAMAGTMTAVHATTQLIQQHLMERSA